MFHKTCKICGCSFDSDARNKVYCSDECAERGKKKATSKRKRNAARRKEYSSDKEVILLINKARALSREIATMLIPMKCSCKSKGHVCDGDLECHHIDHNVFNMHPSNLCWLCKKAHAEVHAAEEDCDMVGEIKAYVKIKEQADIRSRNKAKQGDV